MGEAGTARLVPLLQVITAALNEEEGPPVHFVLLVLEEKTLRCMGSVPHEVMREAFVVALERVDDVLDQVGEEDRPH